MMMRWRRNEEGEEDVVDWDAVGFVVGRTYMGVYLLTPVW